MSNQFVEWFAPFRQRSRRFANEIVSFIDGSAALILGHLRIRADRTSAVGQLFVRCDATIRCGASLQLHASFTVPTLPRSYRFRYLDGWREKETRRALCFGWCFEKALAVFFERRMPD